MRSERTHVLLDLDGTLSDSEPGILRSLQWAFEKEGFPIPTEEQVRSVIGPPFEIGLPQIGIPDDALERVIDRYRECYATIGAFENTLGGDGDPLDALVLLEYPVYPGTHMNVRPVGMLLMEDDGGQDEKLLCVLEKDPRFAHIQDIQDVPQQTKNEIEHFFEHYKDLEPGKWVKLGGWQNKAAAEKVLAAGYESYKG